MDNFFERFFSSRFLPRFLTVVGLILFFYSTIALFIYRHNPILSIDYYFSLSTGIFFIIYGFILEHNVKQTELLENVAFLFSQPLKVEPVKKTEPQLKSESKTEQVNSKPVKSVPISEPVSEPIPKRVVKPVSPEEQAKVREQVRQRMLEQQRLELLEHQRLEKLAQNKPLSSG